jgi:class 3 adenylate cyclase
MVSSTDITKAFGDSTALGLVRRYRDIVRRALLDHGGREVDRAGDGFLTSFASVYAAVKCAITIQRELSRDNVDRTDGVAVQARIGIGAGEPVQDGDALFGSIVNLTSRICDCGEPGQMILSAWNGSSIQADYHEVVIHHGFLWKIILLKTCCIWYLSCR